MSKTNHPRSPGRIVHIRRDNADGKLVAVRRASSLKQALQQYYKETLSQKGYHDPVYTGNSVTVTFRKQNSATYVALEAK